MRILYILSSYNIYGGTPKKTLDLMKHFRERSSLYVYDNSYSEFKELFQATGGNVYEGFHGWNIIKHLRDIIKIVDQNKISIVQTQFSMGETLGLLLKFFRPQIKLMVAFVGPFSPTGFKKWMANKVYKKTDAFVFISKYVKSEKIRQFPVLENRFGKIIFNGTEKRVNDGSETVDLQSISLLDIAGLIGWKNIQVAVKALDILINIQGLRNIFFYVAGEGPMRKELENMITKFNLNDHIFLLGYQKNVGALIDACDIFVHPAYAEGFGIAVAEAMMAEKPIIVANAGALPELIEHEKSGLVIDPFDPQKWADAVVTLLDNQDYAKNLAQNAKARAMADFSREKFVTGYNNFYESLVG